MHFLKLVLNAPATGYGNRRCGNVGGFVRSQKGNHAGNFFSFAHATQGGVIENRLLVFAGHEFLDGGCTGETRQDRVDGDTVRPMGAILSAVSESVLGFLSNKIKSAPFKAKTSAQALPIPCPAPVINAIWPPSPIVFLSFNTSKGVF